MLRAILNKSWRQHPTKPHLYGHLPPITKTIKVRRTRHARHYWRSWDELISDVLQWTPSYGRTKAGRPARTYIQQLSEDTRCSPEDLPEAINDKEEWRERVRDIRAGGTTWWWWWYSNLHFSIIHLNFRIFLFSPEDCICTPPTARIQYGHRPTVTCFCSHSLYYGLICKTSLLDLTLWQAPIFRVQGV